MQVGHSAHPVDTTAGPAPVLVVDDDPQIRALIQDVLEDAGLTVETAADGRQAVQPGADRRPAAAILDLTLPVLSGEAVAAWLQDVYGAGFPIVVLTADDRGAERAVNLGAIAYLHKPFLLDDLIKAAQLAVKLKRPD